MSMNKSSLWHLYRGAPSEHTEMMPLLDNPLVWWFVLTHEQITEGPRQIMLNNHPFVVTVDELISCLHVTINGK